MKSEDNLRKRRLAALCITEEEEEEEEDGSFGNKVANVNNFKNVVHVIKLMGVFVLM